MAGFRTQAWGLDELLGDLDRCKVVLPEFQRDFVWWPKDIDLLLTSLSQGFPAGSLLFLKSSTSQTLGWRPVAGVERNGNPLPEYLVLDGQQRLTSLSRALKGRGEHLFFMDLMLLADGNIEEGIFYVRRDRAQRKKLDVRDVQFERHMYPLGAVFGDDASSKNWFEDYALHHHNEHGAELAERLGWVRALRERYIDPLRQYAFPVVELPADTGLEQVCQIFETLNKTGMKLTVFDLLTAKFWPEGLRLREMLDEAGERWPLLGETGFDVDATYLLQAISLLRSADAPKCRRSDLLELSAEGFAEDWERVCQAASSAMTMLRDECGVLTREWMPYMALLPALFTAVVRVHELEGPAQAPAWGKVRRWFWCCCFGQRYEGPVNTLNAADARALLAWLEDDEAVPEAVSSFVLDEVDLRSVRRQRNALYRAVICLTITNGARDFHNGQKLTADLLRDPKLKIEDHHIVPSGYLKKQPGHEKGEDSILNRCLIDRITNRVIAAKPPASYLSEIATLVGEQKLAETLDSHLIPADEGSALRADPLDLEKFLSERERKLIPAIANLTGSDLHVPDRAETYLDPSRSYSNELALRRVIRALEGRVFWYEQHLPGKALELLSDDLDRDQVTMLCLLSGPAHVNPKTQAAFAHFQEEMAAAGITCEWRVLPKDRARNFHARVLFDDRVTYELPPVNSILSGTLDSIRRSNIPRVPFEEAWDSPEAAMIADFEETPTAS